MSCKANTERIPDGAKMDVTEELNQPLVLSC